MNRRTTILAMLVALCGATPDGGSAQAATLGEAAVRDLYERAARDHNAGVRATQEDFLAAFTPTTQEAWRAARLGPGPAIAGPVVNAFFGPVLPGVQVTLVDVATLDQGPGYSLVRVNLRVRGVATHVDVSAKLIGGRFWRIDNIRYANGATFLGLQRR